MSLYKRGDKILDLEKFPVSKYSNFLKLQQGKTIPAILMNSHREEKYAQSCATAKKKGSLLFIYTYSSRGQRLGFLKLIKAHIFTYANFLGPLIP